MKSFDPIELSNIKTLDDLIKYYEGFDDEQIIPFDSYKDALHRCGQGWLIDARPLEEPIPAGFRIANNSKFNTNPQLVNDIHHNRISETILAPAGKCMADLCQVVNNAKKPKRELIDWLCRLKR